ncbi:MAG: ornithine cyclodeaminase family protein, partial [Candidatus Zixiibacteriota bacterium]
SAGLPTVMATILLIDPKNGFPLAVMDGTHITNMRTGAAGGIAIKYLAKEKCRKIAFIGAGTQAQTQLEAAMQARPKLEQAVAFDLDRNKAEKFVKFCKDRFGLTAAVAESIHVACDGADIINTTTSSRKPIVMHKDVSKGAHINAIGADAMGKQELDPAILKVAKVVIDNWEQASHSGEINVPIHDGKFAQKDIAGELGKVVAKNQKVRKSEDDITVFDSTGLAIQDLVTAWHVYQEMSVKHREALQPFGLFS